MKASTKSRGASKKQPCTGCGDKGLVAYMKGKPAAKAAFARTTDFKPAKGTKKKPYVKP